MLAVGVKQVQRKCACGESVGPSGHCKQCAGKPSTVPRRARRRKDGIPAVVRFSRVRVHADAKAAESAKAIDALVYTVGRDVVFGAGRYMPDTPPGKALLAHELAHVVQQQDRAPALPTSIAAESDPAEREAQQAALAVAHGGKAAVRGQVTAALHRMPAWNSDALGIDFEPLEPSTRPQISYSEDGMLSQRMSEKHPAYRGPFCQNSRLPFNCNLTFLVDYADDPRPRPFTPPELKVEFKFAPPRGGFTRSFTDAKPRYNGASQPLLTTFGHHFEFVLDDNGPFSMRFQMHDPDSGITRIYSDTIQVEAKRPCA